MMLPQELVDTIIDFLFDDKDSLNSCALVSKSWLPSSRFHLFHTVALASTDTDKRRRLHDLITANPHIGNCIHYLQLSVPSEEDTALEALLPLLPSLRKLNLTSGSLVPWLSIPLSIRTTILRTVFPLDSLVYLCLRNWEFDDTEEFERLLESCGRNLKVLSLWCVKFLAYKQTSAEEGEPKPPPIKLDSLILDYVDCPSLCEWLLSEPRTLDLTSLTSLRLAHSTDTHSSIQTLLITLGPSLEKFHYKPGVSLISSPLDLSSNSSLHTIHLTLEEPEALGWAVDAVASLPSASTSSSEHTESEEPIPDLPDQEDPGLTSPMKSTSPLTNLTLDLYIPPSKLPPPSAWARLVDVLSDSVKEVGIGIWAKKGSVEWERVEGMLGLIETEVDREEEKTGEEGEKVVLISEGEQDEDPEIGVKSLNLCEIEGEAEIEAKVEVANSEEEEEEQDVVIHHHHIPKGKHKVEPIPINVPIPESESDTSSSSSASSSASSSSSSVSSLLSNRGLAKSKSKSRSRLDVDAKLKPKARLSDVIRIYQLGTKSQRASI
ncbi:hypothetical protein VKT23_013525 [Stygiomarasmius scandens]|uniref:F-box domain-containing protein n=1 Tax=Marasmiellus scandens TaxID=2682957 RepID=A0ABR1J2Q5_9AGAR